MKLYYKVKLDGKWTWLASTEHSMKTAKQYCECRVCKTPDSHLDNGGREQ